MKQLFFAPALITAEKGTLLKPRQTNVLKNLIGMVCKQEQNELSGRIGSNILEQTDWQNVKALLEIPESDKTINMLHINLPNAGTVAQMEVYTWRDEENAVLTGIGCADAHDFVLMRLNDGLLRELGKRLISEMGATPAA